GLWCHPLEHYLVGATYQVVGGGIIQRNLEFFAGPADVRPAAELLKIREGERVEFDRRGERLAVAYKDRLTIYDAGGKPLHTLTGQRNASQFALHPSGRVFAAVRPVVPGKPGKFGQSGL